MQDFERLGSFYLGRGYNLETGRRSDELLLYDSRDLVTHAVCVGMTGSGKTGLCVSLLEEAAIDGIPAIVIDPKEDLGTLLLAFPELRPEDFRPWIDPAEAARRSLDPDAHAAAVAKAWREGLAEWGETPDRIERFRRSADLAIYTPGSRAGLPLGVLGSLKAPRGIEGEGLEQRAASVTSGLLSLSGCPGIPSPVGSTSWSPSSSAAPGRMGAISTSLLSLPESSLRPSRSSVCSMAF